MRKLGILVSAMILLASCGEGRPEGNKPAKPNGAVSGSQTPSVILAIDYAHEKDGTFYHGTISRLDGIPKATWSWEIGGKKQTGDVAINESDFSSICKAVNTLSDFTAHVGVDTGAQMDPKTNHVVGVVLGPGSNPKIQAFLIPVQGTSKEFDAWLKLIGLPSK